MPVTFPSHHLFDLIAIRPIKPINIDPCLQLLWLFVISTSGPVDKIWVKTINLDSLEICGIDIYISKFIQRMANIKLVTE